MSISTRRAGTIMRNYLRKDWGQIDFTYSDGSDSTEAVADITIKNHDDAVRIIIVAYAGGMAQFRVVFDKIEKTAGTLNMVNSYNESTPFFFAFIREDGYLELKHVSSIDKEDQLSGDASEFMYRLLNLCDDEDLKRLTALTH